MNEDENKIKVFASDDNLKSLGELLSNETSRKIIMNLMTNEMYTNEIATKLDIRVSLVIHHLRKLEDLGLVEIIDKKIKRKGEKHRFFKMNFDIFITLDKTKEEIGKKGVLKRIFNASVKVSMLFLVCIGAFLAPFAFNQSELHDIADGKIPIVSELNPLTILLILVIIGLLMYIFIKKKN